jgi:thiamine biosynthesis lipoprotein ApbE
MSARLGRTSFAAIGTTAELLTWPGTALEPALQVLQDVLRAFDLACSRFRPDSELVALNRSSGRWVPVSPLLLTAVEVALTAARQTDGAVVPTVGSRLRLLGYDIDFKAVPPSGPALSPARLAFDAVPGWQSVEVDRPNHRVRAAAGVELDLGSTAKALAADMAAENAAAATGAGVLVSLGGDLAMAGPPPPAGWPVRVTDDHRSPLDAPGQTVHVISGGLATSSTTARSWRRGADLLHHIIDPSTGMPSSGPWRTASVAAASCLDANTAATASIVRGEGAAEWLERMGLPARLVARDGSTCAVAGWPAEAA